MNKNTIKSNISGYGLVFKTVMTDKNIDIEAKGLYAYLSSYAGSSESAYPSVELICGQLNISEKRFKKYRKQLEDAGFLTIKRHRTTNGFSNNVYTINHHSVSGQNVTVTKNTDNKSVSGQFVTEQIVTGQNVCKQIVTEQKVGTKNNSLKNNSLKNNSNKNSSSKSNSNSNDNNNSFKEVLNSYQQNIQPDPPPLIYQKMIDDYEYFGKEIMLFAIEKTALKNEREYRFINYLLSVWRKQGLKTIEAVKQFELIGANKNKNKVVSKELTPKWLTEKTNKQTNVDEVELERERKKLQEELNALWEDEEHAE